MAIDAGIYDQYKPYKFATLADLADSTAKRKETESLNAERQSLTAVRTAQIEKQARDLADAERRQALVQSTIQKHMTPDGKLDQEGVLSDLQANDYDAYAAVSKKFGEVHKEALAAEEADRKRERENGQQVESLLRGIEGDPSQYAYVLPQIAKLKPEVAQYLGPTPDPVKIGHVRDAALSHEEYQKQLDRLDKDATTNEQRVRNRLGVATDPEQWAQAFDAADTLGVSRKISSEGFSRDRFSPQEARRALLGSAGLTANEVLNATKPAAQSAGSDYGRFEADFLEAEAAKRGKTAEQLTPSERVQIKTAARKQYGQADDRPRVAAASGGSGGAVNDVRESVKGMKDGTLPPQLPGRASKDYTAIMAEAHRQGFDLAGAATDWVATQKHIAALNSNQQLRLNQSINQLPDLLDSVDNLASQWKAGRFPALNRATLALAKGGALGKQAATIANQLDAQIADVTSDLGAVYMGGNSPTDHSLKLAEKALSADWDERVLHDMVSLARKNVQTRLHSIQNTGVQGASAGNPYAPAPPAAVATPKPTGRYNPLTGKVEPVQ